MRAWIALLIALFAIPARAEPPKSVVIPDGRYSLDKGIGERWIIRDRSGRRIGTVEPNKVTDGYVIKDRSGRRIGRAR